MDSRIAKALGFGIFALLIAGCSPAKQIKKTEEPPKKEEAAKPEKPVEEPSLRGKDYQDVPELSMVYFDLDQAGLRSDARAILQKNYEALRGHADWEILVEGHCDERGTTAYNLGLGQRRAAAVRQYYMSLGFDGGRVATVSYGKEKPICSESNETCWSKNRRASTKVRVTSGQKG